MSFFSNIFGLKPAEIVIPEADHTHQFETKMVTYAAPRRDVSIGNNQALAEKAMFGVTTVFSKCLLCDTTKKEEILGSQNPQLDDMLDKVDQYGTQYMQREAQTYVFSKYQQQLQPITSVLPLRG